MKKNNSDLSYVGKKYNRLTVIDSNYGRNEKKNVIWKCVCECGNEVIALATSVKNGNTNSCGCYKRDMIRKRFADKRKHPRFENVRLYEIWQGMKKRCLNKNSKRYKDYGGRGIIMCQEWLGDDGFDNFAEWALSNGYTDEMTIERKDVDGNYEPSNCCWITRKQQAKNKRDSIWLEYKGERVRLQDICEQKGLGYSMVYNRIHNKGWDVTEALETPSAQENTLAKKCREHNIKYQTVRDRINKLGWSEEEALNTPSLGLGANISAYGHKFGNRFCKVCRKEFTPTNSKQIYCCEKCHIKSRSKEYKDRIKENKN